MSSGPLSSKARGDRFHYEFGRERLEAALTQLRAKHAEAVERVAKAEHEALVDEVTTERDALVIELETLYPTLAGELAGLLARLRANDARVIPLGIDRAESVARKIPSTGYLGTTPIGWLVDCVKLPPLDPRAAAMGSTIWPPPSPPRAVSLPPALAAFAEARGAAMRASAEAAAKARAAEFNKQTRRVY